jgi:hypothetical protein
VTGGSREAVPRCEPGRLSVHRKGLSLLTPTAHVFRDTKWSRQFAWTTRPLQWHSPLGMTCSWGAGPPDPPWLASLGPSYDRWYDAGVQYGQQGYAKAIFPSCGHVSGPNEGISVSENMDVFCSIR